MQFGYTPGVPHNTAMLCEHFYLPVTDMRDSLFAIARYFSWPKHRSNPIGLP